jgi:hypothetical protein
MNKFIRMIFIKIIKFKIRVLNINQLHNPPNMFSLSIQINNEIKVLYL